MPLVASHVWQSTKKGEKRVGKTLYLWLLEAKDCYMTRLHTLYALDEADAENQVKEVFRECPNLIRVSLSLRPEGFVFMWYKRPGKIEVNEYAE
jgi:hypothetical protein